MTSHITAPLDQDLALANAAERLEDEFDGVFDHETIERMLHDSYDEIAPHAAVTRFLPVMAEHACRQHLHALSWGAEASK
ncbi:MAG: hypothetical protein FWD85_04960 [Microbacteriaceae bacterium]|nr:hypothetical protein [Microbacteriaceae bacterium]